MPRKAPDVVQEVRVTFGNAERQLIKTTSNKLAFAEITKGVGSAVGGIGVAGVAIAGLIWVGFSLPDFIDNTSTKLVTFLEKKGYVRYMAPTYGNKIAEAEEELAALFIEMQTINLDTKAGEDRYAQCQARWKVLSTRIKVLTSIIADIAEGRRPGYWTQSSIFSYDAWLEAVYDQEYKEMYGGEYDQDDTSG